MPPSPLVLVNDRGLYCPAGDFYIDPWRPVARAVLTHAHADHARPGSAHYLAAREGGALTRARLGPEAMVETLPYGETCTVNGVRVSLHPAGHVLGSAQVRLEHRGRVWVVSGDYKLDPDPTCAPFEPVRCEVFISESTFGLPVYRWPAPAELMAQINAWWSANAAAGRASLIGAYALGKSQRILAGIDPGLGPIYTHGAVEKLARAYRECGVALPGTRPLAEARKNDLRGALLLAPPSYVGGAGGRRADTATALASGWMLVRGRRRRRVVDRGFVLSDHADWPGLMRAIRESGAGTVLLTHGYVAEMVRWLREQGWQADALSAPFEAEDDPAEPQPGEPQTPGNGDSDAHIGLCEVPSSEATRSTSSHSESLHTDSPDAALSNPAPATSEGEPTAPPPGAA